MARTPFDEFHRYSARIVKESIFGLDEAGEIRASLKFPENDMVRTAKYDITPGPNIVHFASD